MRRDDTWRELIEGGDSGRRTGGSNEDAIMRPRSAKSANPADPVFRTLMDRAAHTCQSAGAGLRRLSWKRQIYSGNVLICRSRHLSSRRSMRDWIARTSFALPHPLKCLADNSRKVPTPGAPVPRRGRESDGRVPLIAIRYCTLELSIQQFGRPRMNLYAISSRGSSTGS